MPAVIDYPNASRPIDRHRFNVRGWVWLGEAQASIAGVEAWSGEHFLGATETLRVRPDVVAALSLPVDARTGFDFFADYLAPVAGQEFELCLRVRLRDGTKTAPLCTQKAALRDDSANTPVTPPHSAGPAASVAVPRPSATAEKTALLPPDHLQVRQVAGVWGPLFYSEGRVILNQIATAFREAGHPLEEAACILDFGCGCGRVLFNFQHLAHRGEIWGSDLDAEAIAWNRANLGHVAKFNTNRALPPTAFPDGKFDAIYAVSVFTHLPEELQFAWLTELRRILSPGGVLVASLHGRHYWGNSDPDVKVEVEARGFAYRTGSPTEGLPDFYMVAFHSEDYVRRRWSWFFDFVGLKEKFIHGLHDAAILRRRDD